MKSTQLIRQFSEIQTRIIQAQNQAYSSINRELIELYWDVGKYVFEKLESAEWGEKTVTQLADYLQISIPGIKGFTRSNMYRMLQFFETYKDNQIVAPLVRQITWTHNLIIFSRCKEPVEREYYIRLCIRERLSKRDLERQINTMVFERTQLGNKNLDVLPISSSKPVADTFKDSYIFEFLDLPEPHNEKDLQKALIKEMKTFILELGNDFLFIGEEYRIPVGNKDFRIDLLFYHRELQCLVAFDLKNEEFMPEHLGKMSFYLEALDRDVKKIHENPSIGVILCNQKDSSVVDYAMSRHISPTLIADYSTKLPDKKLLQDKWKLILNSK
jgi:predicted nuclease of restriction endonuclease-like (RecB) superfamily